MATMGEAGTREIAQARHAEERELGKEGREERRRETPCAPFFAAVPLPLFLLRSPSAAQRRTAQPLSKEDARGRAACGCCARLRSLPGAATLASLSLLPKTCSFCSRLRLCRGRPRLVSQAACPLALLLVFLSAWHYLAMVAESDTLALSFTLSLFPSCLYVSSLGFSPSLPLLFVRHFTCVPGRRHAGDSRPRQEP